MKAHKALSELIGQSSEHFISIDDVNLDNLMRKEGSFDPFPFGY